MDNDLSRRKVLKGLLGSVAALAVCLFGGEARAERIRSYLPEVDDGAKASSDKTKQMASGCRCSCGAGTDTSSTLSSAQGSSRKRR